MSMCCNRIYTYYPRVCYSNYWKKLISNETSIYWEDHYSLKTHSHPTWLGINTIYSTLHRAGNGRGRGVVGTDSPSHLGSPSLATTEGWVVIFGWLAEWQTLPVCRLAQAAAAPRLWDRPRTAGEKIKTIIVNAMPDDAIILMKFDITFLSHNLLTLTLYC